MIIGANASDMAQTREVLHMMLPIALPIARSNDPWLEARILTINSGNVVAIDTIVAPIIIVGIFVFVAIFVAASTKVSPPLITRIKDTMNSGIEKYNSII